jgi:hypothetical protein
MPDEQPFKHMWWIRAEKQMDQGAGKQEGSLDGGKYGV